ncbi:hypothetical protein [Nocardia sp. SYP-A9097]|uniref:hypothetical protein n=1 Tax=Nocardia sp. SYP-A9097 TaxID=2663237 RepID=UPI001E4BDB1A|nr:hypothetical protein [Nocardia sp. SYP-A9097]
MSGLQPGATGESRHPGSLDDAHEEEAPDERPSYLEKSADSAGMGKAAEYLVTAICILATRGQLNISTSIVDDEGVDLVFHLGDYTATLAVQVKARMSDGSVAARGRLQAQIRQATFRPRDDLDLLFHPGGYRAWHAQRSLAGAKPGFRPTEGNTDHPRHTAVLRIGHYGQPG